MTEIADEVIRSGWAAHFHYHYPCPVCGLDWMWTDPPECLSTSYDICPRCGNEFGYSDSGISHEELTKEWIEAGKPWYSRVVNEEQCARLMRSC